MEFDIIWVGTQCDFAREKKNSFIVGLYSDIYRLIFSYVYHDGDHWGLHFDTSLDDLDFYLRSQAYEKSKTLVSIFSQI